MQLPSIWKNIKWKTFYLPFLDVDTTPLLVVTRAEVDAPEGTCLWNNELTNLTTSSNNSLTKQLTCFATSEGVSYSLGTIPSTPDSK